MYCTYNIATWRFRLIIAPVGTKKFHVNFLVISKKLKQMHTLTTVDHSVIKIVQSIYVNPRFQLNSNRIMQIIGTSH